jgi:predicted transcriptional regulator
MATITYRTDEETKQRLSEFAEKQNMSINKAIDVIVGNAIREQEAYYEFQKRASIGDPQKALAILNSKAFA